MCRANVAVHPSTAAQLNPIPTTPEDTSATPSPMEAGVILATRYKTKMCLSIEQGEACVYQNRCMFAHSEEELRTKEQNLADGITTETAIREHRRRVHMQIKQRNKRKEKRREKQQKKELLREMEAQGISLPEYRSPIPAQQQQQQSEDGPSATHHRNGEEVYTHDPYAFPQYPSASFSKQNGKIYQQASFEGADSEGLSAAGCETDESDIAPSPRRPSNGGSSSSCCVVSFESSDFYHYDASSSPRGVAWSHNPYPRVLFEQE